MRETVRALRRGKGMVLDAGDPDSVSAGSFFVNPVVDARRVDAWEAELGVAAAGVPRGSRVSVEGRGRVARRARRDSRRAGARGRVGVSRKHALALVNRGGATRRELLAAARAIRDGVRARFGVELEPEPVFVGCIW